MKRAFPIILTIVFAGTAFANGLGGQRLEKVVGDQIIDIGTDQDTTPVSGEPIQFDFNLLKSDSREPLTNTNVTVDIEHNGKTMVNSDLIMEPPLTLLVYTFPEGGSYTLKTTFYDHDRTMVTGVFPLTIAGSRVSTRLIYLGIFLLCIAGAALVGYTAARKQASKAAA